MNINKKKLLQISPIILTGLGLSLLKMTFATIGLTKTFIIFSSKLFILPPLGALVSLQHMPFIAGLFLAFKFFMAGNALSLAGLPTLCSLLSWASATHGKNRLTDVVDFVMHVLLPLTCMAIFICHPAVGSGWVYALYWLIPLAAYAARTFFDIRSIFTIALASSFVAHAAGTIIWLFCVPSTANTWICLLPVVAIERIGLAAGNSLVYAALYFILPSKIKSWRGLRSDGSSPFCISTGRSSTKPGQPTANIISTQ
jgi:hypothetical protein